MVSGEAFDSIPIDMSTLSLGYTNFNYNDALCETAISPIQSSWIAWSLALASSVFAGTPAQWVGLRISIQERLSETDCAFSTVSTVFIPMNTGGVKRVFQGERKIHSRFARVTFNNQTGASRTIDWQVWGKAVL